MLALAPPAHAEEPDDGDIWARVTKAVGSVEGIEELRVDVRGGVVVLYGIAADDAAADRAVEIASKVEGVIDVESRLTPPPDVGRRLAPVWARLRDLGMRAWQALPLLGVALLAVVLAWGVARLIGGWDWLFQRLVRNKFARDIARQVLRAAIVVGGIILALEILDATAFVGAILGAAGIVGLALGLAFRDLFENYLASILLSVRRPFAAGDLVCIGSDEGHVVALTTRSTLLRTPDGNQLRILNTDVYKSRIVNFTRDPIRRFEFSVGVGVDVNLAAARALGASTMQQMDGVLEDPAPFVVLAELGDSSVVLRHFAWVDQREVDFLKVRGEAIRLVKQAFDEAGYDMPEPIHRVRVERNAPQRQGAPSAPAEAVDIARDPGQDREVARDRIQVAEDDLLESDE